METIDFDKEYNVNGSGSEWQKPKTEVYFLNVPFGKDYKHVVDFSTHKARMDALTALSDKHVTAVNIVRKDTEIVVDGVLQNMEKYNYVMYQNASVSNKWWYAFITGVDYQADHLTKVSIKTDVWQSYLFERKLYKSLVERTHVPKSSDIVGNWLVPEPINYEHTAEVLSQASKLDWHPVWNLNAVSLPYNNSGKFDFKFGGYAIATSEATGGYTFPTSYMDETNINALIKFFKDGVSGETRINDIINLSSIPKWLETAAQQSGLIAQDGTYYVYKKNRGQSVRETYSSYNPNFLACGYKPRNNKLFTSLGKTIKIHNKNGFNMTLSPELFDSEVINGKQKPIFQYTMKPIWANSIKFDVLNYDSSITSVGIPYGATMGIGTNSNMGVAAALNKLSGIGGFALNTVATAYTSASSPSLVGAFGAAGKVFNDLNNVNKSFAPSYVQLGSCTDTCGVLSTYISPEYWECSPTSAQCKVIDDFLDRYGYAANEVLNVNYYSKCRSNWNYIKTQNINLSITGPADDCEELKDIFNSGTTIWHGLDHFGDYDQTNS